MFQTHFRPHLSVGTAVQARLWEVPAVICWMDTPSRPSTFFGLVIGVEVWPCPHWPMVLFPQAYTSFSEERTTAHILKPDIFISLFMIFISNIEITDFYLSMVSYHETELNSDCLHMRCRWSWWYSGLLWTWVSERWFQRSHILNTSHSPTQTPEKIRINTNLIFAVFTLSTYLSF